MPSAEYEASEQYVVRTAAADDAQIIARQRALMFRDMGSVSEDELELLRRASQPWLSANLTAGDYIGWFVEHSKTVVAGCGIHLRELAPVPGCYRIGRWAHIANLYTDPANRRRGLARRLMRTMLDWCMSHGIDHVTLSASDEGRPLYESLGFEPTSDMKLSKSVSVGLSQNRCPNITR
jgi:GNAT superfamily N-acetyltransferase